MLFKATQMIYIVSIQPAMFQSYAVESTTKTAIVVDLIRRSIITLLDHFLLGPHLQIHTCWIPVGTGSSRRILAPLCLPGVATAVGTVRCVPATAIVQPGLRPLSKSLLLFFLLVVSDPAIFAEMPPHFAP